MGSSQLWERGSEKVAFILLLYTYWNSYNNTLQEQKSILLYDNFLNKIKLSKFSRIKKKQVQSWLITQNLLYDQDHLKLKKIRKTVCFIERNSYDSRESKYFFFKFYLFIFRERERERGRGRETSVCGCLSCAYYWGPGLQTRHVPWLGIEPATLWFAACTQSTELHHPGLKYLCEILTYFNCGYQ